MKAAASEGRSAGSDPITLAVIVVAVVVIPVVAVVPGTVPGVGVGVGAGADGLLQEPTALDDKATAGTASATGTTVEAGSEAGAAALIVELRLLTVFLVVFFFFPSADAAPSPLVGRLVEPSFALLPLLPLLPLLRVRSE